MAAQRLAIYIVNGAPQLFSAFSDAMKSCGATWLWHHMPRPYEQTRAIFLPRAEVLSMRVAQAFQAAGFTELGRHLEEVARRDKPEVVARHL